MRLRATLAQLKISTPRTLIRGAMREDLGGISAWPPYPWPYDVFNMTAPQSRGADGRFWWERIDEPERLHLSVISRETDEVIGVHVLARVDWEKGLVHNMGVRIRADYCGKGYGAETFSALLDTLFKNGITKVRLDVAASNARAVRCYEKCGMRIVDEFWREHLGGEPNPDDPQWSFALPHLKREGGKWLTRFYWMEIGI